MADSAEELTKRARAFEERGDWKGATSAWVRLARSFPMSGEAHHNLARALRISGRHTEALAAAREAARMLPTHPAVRNSLGLSYENVGRVDDALATYRAILEAKPDYLPAISNLGRILVDREELEDAVRLLEGAVASNPTDLAIKVNLANAYLGTGKPAEAEALIDGIDIFQAHNVRGVSRYIRRDFARAAEAFRAAIAAAPDFAEAHENLAQALLQLGEYQQAWEENEWRWKNPANHLTKRIFQEPLWDGKPLKRRTLLLHGEQGFGDTIQFARFASMIDKGRGRILFAAQEELAPVLRTVPGIDEVYVLGEPLPKFDCQAPVVTVRRLLGTRFDTVPDPSPYITAVPDAATAAEPGLRIGVCWAGRPRHERDPHRDRSCESTHFAGIAKFPGVRLYSFQTGPRAAEVTALRTAAGVPISDLAPRLRNFGETARFVAAMDLIVSVDTALAHLAGALAKPVWVMPPYCSDWRWVPRADGSQPWYRSAQVFRQESPGDWDGVAIRIEAALRDFSDRYKNAPQNNIS